MSTMSFIIEADQNAKIPGHHYARCFFL